MNVFRNMKREKELIDQEVEIYKQAKIREKGLIDQELAAYKRQKLTEIALDIAEAQEEGAKQERDYECTWHSKREELNTEIARLESTKKLYTSLLEERNKYFLDAHKSVMSAKDETIRILRDALSELTKKIPTDFTTTVPSNK